LEVSFFITIFVIRKENITTMTLWIARDLSNNLSLFSNKPKLQFINNYNKQIWVGDFVADVKPDLFPEVSYVNSPQQIVIKLVK
jgi:hypothetical protein